MAVPHSVCVAARDSLATVADAEHLAIAHRSEGLSYNALLSILARKVDAHVKATIGHHRRPEVAREYVRRFEAGESLLTLATSVELPPTMLARVVLESRLGLRKGREVGQLLRQPQLIPGDSDGATARLRRDVALAVDGDPHCGPHIDTCRRLAGLEYEVLLAQKLRALGVPFLAEESLRQRGDAKTPDALLPVPLLVRGRVVHWIDSKATFGDAESHAEYRATQFASYLHRFDAGLVLYWFGYDASIDTDPRLVLDDDLRAGDCELITACVGVRGDRIATRASSTPGTMPT